jgi:hypothetical protein
MAIKGKMQTAHIVLFVYNRPWHLAQTVEALRKNILADQSHLIIYSDGPKGIADQNKVEEVRKYLLTIEGFKSIKIVERPVNYGLANSIISGVTESIHQYGRIIVLEDDLVTSPFFLRYMNEALSYYEKEEKVISIVGYIYPVDKLPQTFFLKGTDCWGWATWRRSWNLFEEDGRKLLAELKKKKLTKLFDYYGAYHYTEMLEHQIQGKISSWAIRWHASGFIKGLLSLYPGQSLVSHIGGDGSGTHCGVADRLKVQLSTSPIAIGGVPIEENEFARKKVRQFMASLKPPLLIRAKLLAKRIIKSILFLNKHYSY